MIIKSLSNIKQIASIVILVHVSLIISAKDIAGKKYYREQVYLHIGRDTYISGEKILLKAYCQNISNPAVPAVSKVIYIELLNSNNNHVMGQILDASSGSSESCIDLPDTLSSGLYFLKSYTRWMQNFGPETFFSKPIFIYNYYNEGSPNNNSTFKIPDQHKLFIESSNLIAGIETKIGVSFPEFRGNKFTMSVIDIDSNVLVTEFLINENGLGYFTLQPAAGKNYACVIRDTTGTKFEYKLPVIADLGYKIKILDISDENITLKVVCNKDISQNLQLDLFREGIFIENKVLTTSTVNDNIIIPIPGKTGVKIEAALKDPFGKTLATSACQLKSADLINIQSLKKTYDPGEKVDLNIINKNAKPSYNSDLSVCIYKSYPVIGNNKIFTGNNQFSSSYLSASLNDKADLLLPAYTNNVLSNSNNPNDKINPESLLSAEDLGIIYTGTVLGKNNVPVQDITVIYSIKDTIPNLQSIITDKDGRFAFLVDQTDNSQNYIRLYQDQVSVSRKYNILLDKKFYFQEQSSILAQEYQSADPAFISEIKDEAQRALIQKAFANQENNNGNIIVSNNYRPEYFTKSVIKVIPDDFFNMDNFEEIAKEILPRVQFKRSKDECMISIYTSGMLKSFYPLVLLNSVPVDDICELNELNSEMIDKIYIQYEPRIVGNLYYDGLISILTYPEIKLKNMNTNSHNKFNLQCYKTCSKYDPLLINKPAGTKSNLPDFRNLLYWNSAILKDGQTIPVQFITSDEEGQFTIEVSGFMKDGTPVYYSDTFSVKSK